MGVVIKRNTACPTASAYGLPYNITVTTDESCLRGIIQQLDTMKLAYEEITVISSQCEAETGALEHIPEKKTRKYL